MRPGAQFRWDASKYIFIKDSVSYTHTYYLEFDFTNWAGLSGAEYLNGTLNNNGTILEGEISHKLYYGQTLPRTWATVILDVLSAAYPIYI